MVSDRDVFSSSKKKSTKQNFNKLLLTQDTSPNIHGSADSGPKRSDVAHSSPSCGVPIKDFASSVSRKYLHLQTAECRLKGKDAPFKSII